MIYIKRQIHIIAKGNYVNLQLKLPQKYMLFDLAILLLGIYIKVIIMSINKDSYVRVRHNSPIEVCIPIF